MNTDRLERTPAKLNVTELLHSRYTGGRRPASWDLRRDGNDFVRSDDGKVIKLWSDGGQTPPKAGSVLMITGGDDQAGYSWTLYGIAR